MSYARRVDGKRRIKLANFDPQDVAGLTQEVGEKKLAALIEELKVLQELLYADRTQSLLVVLQGRDTSGKDGTIRNVAGPLNSQSCTVASFKAPSELELAHDFLWRVHAQTPVAGDIKIFNRSHYEDVLVARIHKLAPKKIWRRRYEHINAFENLLADSNTIILKFYLHISKEEQEQRLLNREQDPVKSWKLSVDDWKEREHWDDYTAAYEDAINRCSTKRAPWFIVPSDKKWFRDLVIAESLRNALLPFKKNWLATLEKVGREKKKAIEKYRRRHNITL
jgi:PPK2 family polyphosphate:nucleotide phosphotransferase